MEILGDRTFVEIPGERLHELPPLLVNRASGLEPSAVVELAADVVESEDLLGSLPLDVLVDEREAARRKMDLALNLVDQYKGLLAHWSWGDSILEWIRQCEITFQGSAALRHLLRNDVWPHAGRASFVTLLHDKQVGRDSQMPVDLERAVGLRLTFRQPPALDCFSNQFLFYLNHSVAHTAFATWQQMSRPPVSALPPERFRFGVHVM